MKKYGYLLGYILGTFILAPLLIYWYNGSKENKVTNADIQQYLNNSTTIKLHLKAAFPNNGDYGKYRVLYSNNYIQEYSYPFYSKEYSAYFSIKNYVLGGLWNLTMESTNFNDTIIAYVNKDELHNKSMGTATMPIPILKMFIQGKDSTVLFGNDSVNLNTSQRHYLFNIHEYLKYNMSHKDFNRIFKK